MTGIPQRMVDNNLGPDRLAGPKALGLMKGIVKFEYILSIQIRINISSATPIICFMLEIR